MNDSMPDGGKKTETIRVACSDELLLRCTKLANADDRSLSAWVCRQLGIICELHDRGVDLSVVVPRKTLSPSDDD